MAGLFFLLYLPAHANNLTRPTTNISGDIGLNMVPSARMDESGTIRLNFGTSDPFLHQSLGVQIASPLYVGLRQTAVISSLSEDALRLYPGMDFKLRLAEESRIMPEIALGLQSAFGHKESASEYLALSKRYHDFDFTAGIAWGRLGSAAHMSNPLKGISSHFAKKRNIDSEIPHTPDEWFTGQDIGFFAGLEYHTPMDGVSIKADWGGDRYLSESEKFAFDAPAPWSLGFNIAPSPHLSVGAAIIGGEKIMANVSLRGIAGKWPLGREPLFMEPEPLPQLSRARPAYGSAAHVNRAALISPIRLRDIRDSDGKNQVSGSLWLSPIKNTPHQIAQAASLMANYAAPQTEALSLRLRSMGLEGPAITINRRDFENAMRPYGAGSVQEIWQTLQFQNTIESDRPFFGKWLGWEQHTFNIVLDNRISLSEEDSGFLYRTAIIAEEQTQITEKVWGGASFRINLADNLDDLRLVRPRSLLPVRNDEDIFAQSRFALDRSYIGFMTTLKPDLHLAIKGGYLEEMYAGLGGEILYRPFGRNFAIGAEIWQAFKRDPFTDMNLGFTGDALLTGHLQGWYEFPNRDLTLQVRAGRYLAEDIGGTVSLTHGFANGASFGAFVTATDQADFDAFGGTTHLFSGLEMKWPLGQIPKTQNISAEVRVRAAPIGRDNGQALDTPVPLYDVSEKMSYRHIGQYWRDFSQ